MANQIDLILQIVTNIENKVDGMSRDMVTKQDCSERRTNCIYSKKFEWNVKKITALAGLITAFFAGVYSLAKLI